MWKVRYNGLQEEEKNDTLAETSTSSAITAHATAERQLLQPHHTVYSRDNSTHIDYHFTALAGAYLCEDLQNEGLGDIPGQIPHIPAKGKRWGSWALVKQEVACKQRLVNQASLQPTTMNYSDIKAINELEQNIVGDSVCFTKTVRVISPSHWRCPTPSPRALTWLVRQLAKDTANRFTGLKLSVLAARHFI